MSVTMKVVLQGLPERIQEAADTLDRAFPGMINWRRQAKLGRDASMQLEGVASPCNEALRPPGLIVLPPVAGKAWKLSSSAARQGNQRPLFCASLSRSFQP